MGLPPQTPPDERIEGLALWGVWGQNGRRSSLGFALKFTNWRRSDSLSGTGGMGGRAVGSSFGSLTQKTLRAACGAPHRDWPREARVPHARSERSNQGLVPICPGATRDVLPV